MHEALVLHHAVKRDLRGRILAWYQPGGNVGYDHVIRAAWRFLERSVPRDRRWRTGLPVYLVSSVYDRDTDTLSIILRDGRVVDSDEPKPGMILDYDKAGRLLSIELLDASDQVKSPQNVEFTLAARE